MEQWSSFPPPKIIIGLFPIVFKKLKLFGVLKKLRIVKTGTKVSFSKVVKIAQISPNHLEFFPTFIKTSKSFIKIVKKISMNWNCFLCQNCYSIWVYRHTTLYLWFCRDFSTLQWFGQEINGTIKSWMRKSLKKQRL